ncbi:MAG TPA: hypothetical protein DCG19_13810 [Cryomorphaceae bacterium]|nr:hypothetical protein [Owenweeksia sp.]HAD98480.1 hypothetical protein [Cryomorphaceae bacterium]|tara:strand:- start:2388 stop:2879 length:492 start_codon:yes stop_codon:yes gene_type:complete
MKQTFLLIVTSLIPFFGLGQDAVWNHERATETDSLYRTAIEKFIGEMDPLSDTTSKGEAAKTIFIQAENYLSMLPSHLEGYEIQLVGYGNREDVFKQNGYHLRLIRISPLTLKNGQFQITLSSYNAELKRRKHLDLALSDWTIVLFNFKDGHLIYSETKRGGV